MGGDHMLGEVPGEGEGHTYDETTFAKPKLGGWSLAYSEYAKLHPPSDWVHHHTYRTH